MFWEQTSAYDDGSNVCQALTAGLAGVGVRKRSFGRLRERDRLHSQPLPIPALIGGSYVQLVCHIQQPVMGILVNEFMREESDRLDLVGGGRAAGMEANHRI